MMKSAPLLLIISLSVVTLNGCSTPPPPSMSPLQLQEMQTHRVDADMKTTFNAVMNVLQDKNYQIVSADVNSGFIKAQSENIDTVSSLNKSLAIIPEVFGTSLYADYHQLHTTIILEDIDNNQTKLRFNIKEHEHKVGTNQSTYDIDTTIKDAKAYQSMFEAIDQQLFQQKMLK
ncbi:hypothetical protein [Edaphovirga cremea]|uniref:hypothetical protein n=1 Tax=Edaphovirga cremea TaxID=2267246 RepID=UPI003988A5E9